MSRKKKGKITIRKIGHPEPTAAAPEVSNDLIRERRSEAARLKAQGADVNADKRTGEILGAWRRDVFTILRNRHGKPTDGFPKGRPALSQRAYEAFRGHETDIHLSEGASGGDRRPDFIRATCEGAPGQNVTQESAGFLGQSAHKRWDRPLWASR